MTLCYYGLSIQRLAAHATLLESSPAPGESWTAPVTGREIRLHFDEEVGAGSSFVVFDQQFQQIEVAVSIDSNEPTDLVAIMPDQVQNGTYTIQWLVISADGHPIEGTYSFNVIDTGEENMDLIALAEGTAFNPPNWVGVLMVILAIVVPFIVYYSLKGSK